VISFVNGRPLPFGLFATYYSPFGSIFQHDSFRKKINFPDEAYQMQEQEYERQYVKLKLQQIGLKAII
jgi:hypothetical protein